MLKDLIATICRKSDRVENFLREISTCEDTNIGDVIHILRKILYKHGENTDKYLEEYESEYKNDLTENTSSVIEKIFSTEYKQQKEELISNCRLWKEDRIVETFNNWRDFKDYLRWCCFTEDYVVYSQGTFYIKTDRCWKETTTIEYQVRNFVSNQLFSIKNGDKTIDINTPSKWKETYDGMKGQFPINPKFRDAMFEYEKGRLFFTDGAYNFETQRFEEGNNNTRIYIDRKFPRKSNPKIREELYKRVFHPFFTIREEEHPDNKRQREIMDYYFYNVSQSISGLGTNKYPLFIQGTRDGGKGILCKLTGYTFDNYVGTFQFCNLKLGKNADGVRDNALWSSYDTKRIAQSCEDMDKTFIIDGSKIKRIFSGGDKIQFRNLYQESSTTRIMPHMFSYMNDLPKISGEDAEEKIILLRLHTRFYNDDKHNLEYRKRYPELLWVEEDTEIEKFISINRTDVNDEYLLMIIEASKEVKNIPQQIKEDKQEQETETIEDIVENTYQLGDENSFIPYPDLSAFLEIHDSRKILGIFRRVFGADKIKSYPNRKVKGKRGVWGVEIIEDYIEL